MINLLLQKWEVIQSNAKTFTNYAYYIETSFSIPERNVINKVEIEMNKSFEQFHQDGNVLLSIYFSCCSSTLKALGRRFKNFHPFDPITCFAEKTVYEMVLSFRSLEAYVVVCDYRLVKRNVHFTLIKLH